MQAVLWPIHCSGRLWSYALFRVPAGYAFVPLETTTATLLGSGLGLAAAIGLAVWAGGAGWASGQVVLGLQVAATVGGGYGARRWAAADARRRMARFAADPARAARRWGAFVLPASAQVLATLEASDGGKAQVRWLDAKGKPRQAVLTVPSNLLADFAALWKDGARGP